MKRSAIALLLVMTLGASHPAPAADNEAVVRCILQEILSALTCKKTTEFRFMGKRDEVYVFNAHYAAQFTEFYCQIFDRDVIITSKAWKGNMASARLNYEVNPGCITATVNSPWEECRQPATVQCCGVD